MGMMISTSQFLQKNLEKGKPVSYQGGSTTHRGIPKGIMWDDDDDVDEDDFNPMKKLRR